MTEIEQLERELGRLDERAEEAALEEDAGEFLRLAMRRVAIPALIREARAAPVRREIERLEEELAALEAESKHVREQPQPTVPAGRRQHVTPAMLRNAELGSITARAIRLGGELKAKQQELAQIEREGPRKLLD